VINVTYVIELYNLNGMHFTVCMDTALLAMLLTSASFSKRGLGM